MRIAVVCLEFARAGRMRGLAEGLVARGHDVVFITSEASANSDAYRVVALPYTSSGDLAKRAAGLSTQANMAQIAASRGRMAERAVRTVARVRDEYLLFPDKQRAWRPVVRAWLDGSPAELEGVEWVVASMPPVTALNIGRDIARVTGARLLFDFRDLWTHNPYYPYGHIRRFLDRLTERRLFPSADALVTATQPFAEQLSAAYDVDPVAVYTGIDPGPWRQAAWQRDDSVLRFAHIGITYGGKRDVRPFLRAIARLADTGTLEREHIRVSLIGEADEPARDEIRALDISDLVEAPGMIAAADVAHALARTDVALIVMWPGDSVSIPLKAKHYLAAQKRILVVGADAGSDLVRVLAGMPGVDICSTDTELDEALFRIVTDWRSGTGFVWADETRPFTSTQTAMADGFLSAMEGA